MHQTSPTALPFSLSVPDRREDLRTQLVSSVGALIGTEASLQTSIPGVTLYRYCAPTLPESATYEPSVALVVQGRKRVTLGRTSFDYDPSRFLLTSLDLPVTSQVVEASREVPYLCMRLKLDIAMVRELLGREPDKAGLARSGKPAMTTAETTAEFLDAFGRLLDLHHAPQDIDYMGGLIKREIIYRILQGAAGQRLRSIATIGENSQRTAKAVEWIRDNYTKPLRVDMLAKVACMGVSTLHHHFRALTSMSPLQYQKQLRLQEARRRMLVDGLDAAHAAFEVGYESASQFNREYSRFFGQSPMRDVRSLRVVGDDE
ncbi:AraC family transcriptional regulator [Pseudoduganella albidiflava]|uniref:AraC family transcriptional regulator n=1 Tax=Pseudoduganella albidiflava TaxID=321983 RepID=A0AA87Y518_9BURK|nr:AraC family transcriptional regulator [Pseudoduganella albidiflava]GGY67442.1 AraC family transcriptional regulator [Pseudoduganella albidiflava]